MKLTRTSQYKLNMGNYESHEVGATISLDVTDLFDEDELADMTYEQKKAELRKAVHAWLAEEIDPALEAAAEVSQAKDSILPAPKEKEPPRRTERVTRRSTR